MTDKTPAMPELPETAYSLFYEQPGDIEGEGYQYVLDEPGFTADQMRAYARAALSSQPSPELAGVSDEPTEAQIAAGMRELFAGPKPWPSWEVTLKRVYQAMFALRPQSESEARRAAQEQLYTERERHTAEVKRLQAEIGRLQSLSPQAVPMTGGWQEVAACPDGDVWFSLSCGHVVMGWKQGPLLLDWEAAVDHDCCSDASAIKAMPVTPPAHHGITAPAGGEGK